MNVQGTLIEPWVISGQSTMVKTSAYACPVQQRPTAWKAWKDALELLAPEGQVTLTLGT
jgi:hypothetical protein